MHKVSSLNLNDFSPVSGGPFNRLLMRSHLVETEYHHTYGRGTFFALLTRVPLLFLRALRCAARRSTEKIRFLYYFAASTRFLIFGPPLITANIIIDPRISVIAKHFISSGLVREEDL